MTDSLATSGSILNRRNCTSGKGVFNSSTAIFSDWLPTSRKTRTPTERLRSLSRSSMSFQSVVERCIASATCEAVTINPDEANQPVPCMPKRSGHDFSSISLKYRVMLTVTWAVFSGSTHAAPQRDDATSKSSAANVHRVDLPCPSLNNLFRVELTVRGDADLMKLTGTTTRGQ